MSRPRGVSAPSAVRRAIVTHAWRDAPNECCGLLLGRPGWVQSALPAPNLAASPVRFELDPAVHVAVRRVVRNLTPPLQIVGVYHSHPVSEAWPSEADRQQAFYPEWMHVIVSLQRRGGVVRAFSLRSGRVRQIPLRWRQGQARRGVSCSVRRPPQSSASPVPRSERDYWKRSRAGNDEEDRISGRDDPAGNARGRPAVRARPSGRRGTDRRTRTG